MFEQTQLVSSDSDESRINGRQSEVSASSLPSQPSTKATSQPDSIGSSINVAQHAGSNSSQPFANSTDRCELPGPSVRAAKSTDSVKHVPLTPLIDFRVAHTRRALQPQKVFFEPSQRSNSQHHSRLQPEQGHEIQQERLDRSTTDNQHQAQEQTYRLMRDGVPHLMTRQSNVLIESVDGVPLTTTLNSHQNQDNEPTIPEIEAEDIRDIEPPSEEDLQNNLDAEFERYNRHYARSPPAIWHGAHIDQDGVLAAPRRLGGQGGEQPLWSKKAWKERTRQISPRPVNRGANHVFVDGYSRAIPVTAQAREEDGREWPTYRRQSSLDQRPASLRSDESAAPAPVVPIRR